MDDLLICYCVYKTCTIKRDNIYCRRHFIKSKVGQKVHEIYFTKNDDIFQDILKVNTIEMDNYTVAVDYGYNYCLSSEKRVILSLYNKHGEIMLSQPFESHQCSQITKKLKKLEGGEIFCCISLTELYMKIKGNCFVVGVGYGGPCVYIKIKQDLIDAFVQMEEYFAYLELRSQKTQNIKCDRRNFVDICHGNSDIDSNYESEFDDQMTHFDDQICDLADKKSILRQKRYFDNKYKSKQPIKKRIVNRVSTRTRSKTRNTKEFKLNINLHYDDVDYHDSYLDKVKMKKSNSQTSGEKLLKTNPTIELIDNNLENGEDYYYNVFDIETPYNKKLALRKRRDSQEKHKKISAFCLHQKPISKRLSAHKKKYLKPQDKLNRIKMKSLRDYLDFI